MSGRIGGRAGLWRRPKRKSVPCHYNRKHRLNSSPGGSMSPRSLLLRKTLPLLGLLFFSLCCTSHAAQWRPIGPEGASIQSVASGAGGTLYAITAQGTVVISTDGA